MQTDYLRYFIDVATLGSMNSAARKNFMTPQGMSRAMSALESELDCNLFKRDSNKVTLTSFGEKFLDQACEMVALENRMRSSVIEMRSQDVKKQKMRFTCYSSPIFFDTPLFFPVSGVRTASYGRVQFLQRSTPDVVKLLLDAAGAMRNDVVVAGGLGLFDLFGDENDRFIRALCDAGYEYRPFLRTEDYVLVPEYSTLAKAGALAKADIRAHNLAVAASGGMERAIAQHIGADSIYVSSGDSLYRSYLCRMGEALTFVPGVALAFGVPEGTVAVPMQEPYVIEIGFAARASAFREGVLAEAMERLSNFYSQSADDGYFDLLDGSAKTAAFS